MIGTNGPTICVAVGRTRHKMMQAEIQQTAKQGAELIELRLDFLAKPPDFRRLLADKPCPMIATVRRVADGGRFGGSEEERLVLLRQAIVAGFDWVDLETDVIAKVPRFGKVKRIVSYHNLHDVPADLDQIYKHMCQQDADVVKLAVTAQHPSHNLRVFNLLKNNPPKPTVAHCMGDLGICSRVLSAKFGAAFSYAAFNKERSIAPGIISYAELKKSYNYERIDAATKVYGIIGDPVAHSLSPLLHNRIFRHHGINAVYVPFRVPHGDMATFLKDFEQVPVLGFSVTVPHKEEAAQLASWKDDAVTLTGAANTLIRSEAGWRAYNTDVQAGSQSLYANWPIQADGASLPFLSTTVLLLGAGGVARALAKPLQKKGVNLIIANRTAERAKKLAEEVGCRWVEWPARHNVLCDILINGTSIGMHPNLDESPVHNSYLVPPRLIFDTVYTPETTLLIREAKARGCAVLTGVDMFVRQATLQSTLFTGMEAPTEMCRELVRRALSPVNLGQDDTRV
jgi:3-dehydroquinate dehydratase / shikimate dehydrogenase